MTLELLLQNSAVWLAAIAGLFVATGAVMEESIKPFIHAILDSLRWPIERQDNVKSWLIRASALIVAYVIALPLNEVYNMPVVVFGRYAHPAFGILPAVFAAVFVGRQIHDRWGNKNPGEPR